MSGIQEMTTAPYPEVTNELLSAYIDEAVSEDERRLIESAVAQDPNVAWRLESLRATVRLLRELPVLALPRSFLLTPEQVSNPVAAELQAVASLQPDSTPDPVVKAVQPAPGARKAAAPPDGFWQALRRGWAEFWHGGSPALRNAMAASFAVLVVLLLAPRFLTSPSFPAVGEVQTVSSQAPVEAVATAGASEMDTAVAGSAATQAATGESAAAPANPTPVQPAGSPPESASVAAAAQPAAESDAAAKAAPSPVAKTSNTMAATSASSERQPAAPAPAAMAQPTSVSGPPTSGSGASILDDMQRQAGAPAPAPALSASQPGVMSVASSDQAVPAVQSAAASQGTGAGPELAAAGAAATPDGSMPASVESAAPDTQVATAVSAAQAEEPAAVVLATPVAESTAPPAATVAPIPEATSVQVVAALPAATSAPATAPSAPAVRTPAWLALLLQAAAAFVAVVTVVLAVLWWRSRRLQPHA